jgi:hypothetical protein
MTTSTRTRRRIRAALWWVGALAIFAVAAIGGYAAMVVIGR